jgi:hypothetical protein
VAAALSVLAYVAGLAAFWGHRPAAVNGLSAKRTSGRGLRKPGGFPSYLA